jgi:antitoxin component YwqK of YwqJK toxin-antitoxin module
MPKEIYIVTDDKKYIITAELLEDSKTNINREDVIDIDKATHITDKCKIIQIEDYEFNNKYDTIEACFSFYNNKLSVNDNMVRCNYNLDGKLLDGIHFFTDKNYIADYFKISIENGILYKYNPFTGALLIKAEFQNNSRNGIFNIYYDSSQSNIKIESNIVNELKHGLYREYYPDGNLRVECNYNKDMIDGELKQFYKNKNLWIRENYKNNKKIGSSSIYYETGEIWEEIEYDENENIIKLVEYDKNKNIIKNK